MEKRVFVVTFEEDSKSYQAFSELKQMHVLKKVQVDQMAVITNMEDEKLKIKDFMDMTGPDKTSRGSIIGILIGLLGGPVGMLLGWVSGAVIGASGDAREVKDAMSAFEQTLAMISTGKTGLMVIATAESREAIQDLVQEEIEGGRVLQLDLELVKREIEHARQTERELQREARKRWFDKNK
ncbi:DUF1269 domain-containing protein [Cerasibacillus terrae]|uniref:DUF1269 domain-containing protein n=1 Tax=Cerasibacillus terrae TaxID=2498845 RepID=A0A5C8NZR0_9BACI|nr:DUF1269 domain-containing protein [Cerasibacillus terrae]TXL66828.1 DUF1269 domain-containing protein [Cerasibacillus terrae]